MPCLIVLKVGTMPLPELFLRSGTYQRCWNYGFVTLQRLIHLHCLSEGTARVVLCHLLSTAVATKLEQEKELTCLIVTGYGKSRKEWNTADVQKASLKLLQEDLGLQAAVLPKNQGAIQVCLREADLPALCGLRESEVDPLL